MVGAGTDRSRAALAGGPAVVLVRPQLAVNIGMCARAMANFGLEDLRLVNPREGWPRVGEYRDLAYAAAAGAAHLLDAARVFDSVEAAIGDLNFLYAATARERGQMKRVIGPSQAMAETALAAEKRGVLFGPERTGLDNDEVALADAIRHLSRQPRLRLAQSRSGGAADRLRMVQGGPRRRAAAACDPTRRLASRAARDDAGVFRLPRGQARRRRLLPAGAQEAGDAPQPAQHVSPHGDDRSRTCARCGARSCASSRGRASKSKTRRRDEANARCHALIAMTQLRPRRSASA